MAVDRTNRIRSTGGYGSFRPEYPYGQHDYAWGYSGGRRTHPPHSELRGWGGSIRASQAGRVPASRRLR